MLVERQAGASRRSVRRRVPRLTASSLSPAASPPHFLCLLVRFDPKISAYVPHNKKWIQDAVFAHLQRQAGQA